MCQPVILRIKEGFGTCSFDFQIKPFYHCLYEMPSQYLIWDRLKVHNTNVPFWMISQIGGFFDIFEKHTCTTFVWVLARTIHNFVKMSISACKGLKNEYFIFLDSLKNLSLAKYKDGKRNHVKRFYNIHTFHFNLIYWGNKTFLSKNKKMKYAKFICDWNKIIR